MELYNLNSIHCRGEKYYLGEVIKIMSNYFRVEEEAKLKFFKVPKALLFEERYKDLSNDCKLLYGVLRDRTDLSLKNNWVDKQGRIYFIYRLDKKTIKDHEDIETEVNDEDSDDNLMDLFGWSKPTIVKKLRELEQFNLLEIQRQGQNKPNLMYLKKVEIDNPNNYFDNSYKNSYYNFLDEDIRNQLKEHLNIEGASTDFNIINKLAKRDATNQMIILSQIFDLSVQRVGQMMFVLDMGVEDGSIKSAKNSIGYFKYLIKMLML